MEAEQQKSYFMIYVNQNSVVVLTGFKASTESLLTPFFIILYFTNSFNNATNPIERSLSFVSRVPKRIIFFTEQENYL